MSLLKQSYVKFGFIASGILIYYLAINYFADNLLSFNEFNIRLAGYFIIVYAIGIWTKKKELKGKMDFKQGFTEGMKITLVYAVLSFFVFLLSPIMPITNSNLLFQLCLTFIVGFIYSAIFSLVFQTRK